MTPSPPPEHSESTRVRRSGRSAAFRFLLLVALGGGGLAILFFTPAREYVDQEKLLALLERIRAHPASPVAVLVAYVVLSPAGAPLTPLLLATAGVFGLWTGTLLNYIGVNLGAAVSFGLARLLGYEFMTRLLGKRHEQMATWIEGKSFWPLVRIRFVPVPFPITNYGSALLGVPWPTFSAATAIAYVPITFVWSYFATALLQATEGQRAAVARNITLAFLLMLALTFLPTLLTRFAQWRASSRERD